MTYMIRHEMGQDAYTDITARIEKGEAFASPEGRKQMKGCKEVAIESQKLKRGQTMPIYYDLSNSTVNTDGFGDMVTELIRPNTEEEIERAVNRWLWF